MRKNTTTPHLEFLNVTQTDAPLGEMGEGRALCLLGQNANSLSAKMGEYHQSRNRKFACQPLQQAIITSRSSSHLTPHTALITLIPNIPNIAIVMAYFFLSFRKEAEAKMRQEKQQHVGATAVSSRSPVSLSSTSYASYPISASQRQSVSSSGVSVPYRPSTSSPFARSNGPPAGVKIHPSRMAQYLSQAAAVDSPPITPLSFTRHGSSSSRRSIDRHKLADSNHVVESEPDPELNPKRDPEPQVVRQRLADPLDGRHWRNYPCRFHEIRNKTEFQTWYCLSCLFCCDRCIGFLHQRKHLITCVPYS